MPAPIAPPLTPAPPAQSSPGATAATAFARQFAGTSIAPPSGSIPFSEAARSRGSPADAARQKDFRAFSTLYSTNAGCKAINRIMRGEPSALNFSEVLAEIGRMHGHEQIPGYKRAGIHIESDMKSIATEAGLQDIAKNIHARADASKLSAARVHRGQGMTSAGVEKLIELRQAGVAVKATNFLSCDKNLDVARSFAGRCDADAEQPVLFQILGFSNVRIRPYIGVAGESESLFAPHATFEIETIGIGKETGYVVVRLKEIPPSPNAVPMPY